MNTNIRVTKSFTFDMAHALYGYDGDCKNIHGHTYHLHITLLGQPENDPQSAKNGMVIDFGALKSVVKQTILNQFDHALVLNKNSPHGELAKQWGHQFEKIIFLEMQPTCENLLPSLSTIAPAFVQQFHKTGRNKTGRNTYLGCIMAGHRQPMM